MEAVLVAVVLLTAIAIALAASRGAGRARLGIVAMVVAGAAGGAVLFRAPAHATVPPERPLPRAGSEYVSSAACRACHPSEHASFSRTFHRTMTQDANAQSVLAPLDGKPTIAEGRAVTLFARGDQRDEAWATLPDPDLIAKYPSAIATAPEVTRRIVLTTGSHKEQTYWVAGARKGELRIVPIVWLIGEKKMIARHDAFLTPPHVPLGPARWNSNCIACHAVAGEPGHDRASDTFDTRAAELGVACEACHGPGRAHVEKHASPFERSMYSAHTPDPTIVLPSRLPPERSAAVCGQCHAYAFPRSEDRFWWSGYTGVFRPGDALEPSRTILSRDLGANAGGNPNEAGAATDAPEIDAPPDSLFWPDGTIRVGGREYNGLVKSPCYEHATGDQKKLTCLSCHSMHEGDPNGQLAPGKTTDAMCNACHAQTPPHSHHAPGSPGRACVSCHMPKTSYALFHATRSHRITTPDAGRSFTSGEPNACNLCHLDKPLAWTATQLRAWYGTREISLPEERTRTAEGMFSALAGDAAVRVLIADALGTADARAASPLPYEGAMLDLLVTDEWAAVRFVAERSRAATVAAQPQTTFAPRDLDDAARAALLLAPDGTPDAVHRKTILAARDDREITIAE